MKNTFALLFLLLTATLFAGTKPPDLYNFQLVNNGCFPESEAYVVKFLKKYPAEQAYTTTVDVPSEDGTKTIVHAIALCTWEGQWWVRDMLDGVSPTGIFDTTHKPDAKIAAKGLVQKYKDHKVTYGAFGVYRPTDIRSENEMIRGVKCRIPYAEVIEVTVLQKFMLGKGKVYREVLVWRSEGALHVYHPEFGTQTAYTKEGKAMDGPTPNLTAAILTLCGWEIAAIKA